MPKYLEQAAWTVTQSLKQGCTILSLGLLSIIEVLSLKKYSLNRIFNFYKYIVIDKD